jgi:hypothetical protein
MMLTTLLHLLPKLRMNGFRTPIPHTPQLIILSLCFFVPFLAAVWKHFTAVKGQSFCLSLSFIQFARPRITSMLKMSLDKIFCAATLHLPPLALSQLFCFLLFLYTDHREKNNKEHPPTRPRCCCI